MKINYNNYEEYLVEYLEGELTPAQEEEVRLFLEQNPELKDELVLLQLTFLDPEEEPVVYQNKASLMREEKGRVLKLSSNWGMIGAIAVAALVIIAIGIVFMLQNQAPATQNTFANASDVPAKKELLSGQKTEAVAEQESSNNNKIETMATVAEGNQVSPEEKNGQANDFNKVKTQSLDKKKNEVFDIAETNTPGGVAEAEIHPMKKKVEPVEMEQLAFNSIEIEKLTPEKIIKKQQEQPEQPAVAKSESSNSIKEVKEKISVFELAAEPKGVLALGKQMLKKVTGDNEPVVVERHEVEGKKRFNVKLEIDQFVLSANF